MNLATAEIKASLIEKYKRSNYNARTKSRIHEIKDFDGRVNALYSTPSSYTDAKCAENESWRLKVDDFFPYVDRVNHYYTGYFTSRPALKGYVRLMSGYYLVGQYNSLWLFARQLEFLKGRCSARPTTDTSADALAIARHHDAVTGTEQHHVANDYAKRLSIGYKEAEELVSGSLACMVEFASKSGCRSLSTKFQQL